MIRTTPFLSILILVACSNGPGDEEFAPPTQILRVDVAPDTVSRGGFVTFTCVIKDSLNQDFEYSWVLFGVLDTVTQTNQLRVEANSTKFLNIGVVNVSHKDRPWNRINKEFNYYVRQ